MVSRREFIQTGIAVSAFPVMIGGTLSPALAGPPPLPLYKLIFDRRFASSVAFAAEATALGLPTHGIDGDMTDLWYGDLHGRWRQSPVAIAGLTAHGPLFCLDMLARDQGMRVVYRGDHEAGPDGATRHALNGPDSMRALGTDWAPQVARLFASCPADAGPACRAASVVEVSQVPWREPEPLISWIIAPVRRA